MPTDPTSVDVEIELSGDGSGWTTLTDVHRGPGIKISYGIRGNTPRDRVASTGTMSFQVNNSPSNSAATTGLYSPDHASKLAGWGVGIGVRLKIVFGGTTYYKWRGFIDTLDPIPGSEREKRVLVTCVDWMDEAAKSMIRNIPLQLDQLSSQVFVTLVEGTGTFGEWAGVPRQPAATSVATGQDTFPHVFDRALEENTSVLTELQRLANSELAYIYLKGDTTQGGTLVFENRLTRGEITTNATTLGDSDMTALSATRSREHILNDVRVKTHPRRVDAAATSVLYTLQHTPSIKTGEDYTFTALYRDPSQQATRVGGLDMVAPVSGTDYTFNSASDGTGTNLVSQLTVTVLPLPAGGANSAEVSVKNSPSGDDGFLTLFRLLGKGVYSYEETVARAADEGSQFEFGLNTFALDMSHQGKPEVAQGAANFILQRNSESFTRLDSVSFLPNHSSALMTQALLREVGDKIGVTETITGLTSSSENQTSPIFSALGYTNGPAATSFGAGAPFRPFPHTDGRYVYVAIPAAAAAHLAVVDINDPASPSYSELTHANFNTPREGVEIADFAYVTDNNAGSIHVIDTSTAGSPSYDSEFTDAGIVNPAEIAGAGSWLYVSNPDPGTAGVKIIDISTPGSPSLDNTYTGTATPVTLVLSNDGNLLVIVDRTNEELLLVNVTDPTSPVLYATVSEDYTDQLVLVEDVEFDANDDFLYVATDTGDTQEKTISVLDIRTPASPVWSTQNEASLLTIDNSGSDVVVLKGLTLQPQDQVLYGMGSSTDAPHEGVSTRGAMFRLLHSTHPFRLATYPPGGVAKGGTTAYKLALVPPFPSTYGVAIVSDDTAVSSPADPPFGAQVFQLRETFSQSVSHFINAIELSISADLIMSCSWFLAPSLSEQFWILGTAGFTELNITTRPGFGVIV